ncbi:hypothetical protein CcaverHIS002_0502090 [Cutaneotrichosporon cavernicola]|nr:hypothetical protein CcaverHIS002_0502090 [Cutaneotrichosporon cavernicola]
MAPPSPSKSNSKPATPPTRQKPEPENLTAPFPPRPDRTRIPTPSRPRSTSPASPISSPSPTPPTRVLQTSSLPRPRSVGCTYKRPPSPPINRQLFYSTRRSKPGTNPFKVVPIPDIPEAPADIQRTEIALPEPPVVRHAPKLDPDLDLELILPELRITSPTPQSTPESHDPPVREQPADSPASECPCCRSLRAEIRSLRLGEMVFDAQRRAWELERGDLIDKIARLEAKLRQ